MAAAAAVVPPGLGAAASPPATARHHEQLLPAAAGQGVAMKVDGHRATVTLGKAGLRCGGGAPAAAPGCRRHA